MPNARRDRAPSLGLHSHANGCLLLLLFFSYLPYGDHREEPGKESVEEEEPGHGGRGEGRYGPVGTAVPRSIVSDYLHTRVPSLLARSILVGGLTLFGFGLILAGVPVFVVVRRRSGGRSPS